MSKRKLLLADDSITIQKVVNLTFADEGIDVITVGDGNAAMAKIAEMAPDVILADVHMPGLSGYQVCEMVRSNEATRGLPVVLLVGSFEPFDENEAARVGANAFLTKPFQSIRQLVSQVSDLMQTSAAASDPEIQEPSVAPSGYAAPDEDIDKTIPAHAPDIDKTAPARVPDTTDIDRLYAQSVGGMASEAEAGTGTPTYVDAGMDDEMIETVHTVGDSAEEEPSESFYQEPTAEYQQPTNEYEIETAGDYQPVANYDQPGEQYQQPVAAFEQSEAAVEEQQQPEQYHFPVDEYREPTVAYHEETATYEQPAESVFQEAVPPVASPFDAPAEETPPVELPIFETTSPYSSPQTGEDISTATTDEFELDEVDLLELPPMEGGQSIQFSTQPGPEGGKQVVSLSPELMDALVEKVVKKLSSKE